MSAVACRTEGSKGSMGGGSAFCAEFLSGITYGITELSHEQIDLYNTQRAT